jgi:hypothetical protein
MGIASINPRRLTTKHLWLGVPIFLLTLKGFIFPLPLLDFWWHLKMGEVILSSGSIPRIDIFSFTAAGKTFIVQNWLSEIILFLIYKLGHFPLLIFFNTLLLVAALLPIYYLCRISSTRFWPPLLSTTLVALCMLANLRPQNFSFLFFSLFYVLLDDYRFKRRDLLWLMPVLMIFWVNLHGGFILGLFLSGLYLASGFVSKLFNQAHKNMLDGKLAVIQILCIFATFVNPEGLGIYKYIYTVLRDPSSQKFVVEWLPPTINTIQGALLFFLPFFVVTFVLIFTRRRIDLIDISIYFLFSILGFSATRNSIYFLLAIGPIISRYMPINADSALNSDREKDNPHGPMRRQSQHGFLNIIIACAALVALGINSPWVRSNVFKKSLLEPKTPVGAMNYIDEHSLKGNIFHPQIYGDYLIWRLWPKQRSFFDGRVHLFGEAFVRYYQKLLNDSNWEELLKKYDIDYLLFSKEDSPKSMIKDARTSNTWIVLYEDAHSILFQIREKR